MGKKSQHLSKKDEKMQEIYHAYMAEFGVTIIQKKEVVRWAIKTGRWKRPYKSDEQLCMEEMSRAMRKEVWQDPQGRVVRVMHPMRKLEGEQPLFEWADIRIASSDHMHAALSLKRQGILSDVLRHKDEADSFNDNNPNGKATPLAFDYNFNKDIEEGALPSEYNEEDADLEFETEEELVKIES